MSLFGIFGKKAKEEPPQEREEENSAQSLEPYSGMRVEVTTDTGEILFVAKLMDPHGNQAELHQYSESELVRDVASVHVNIRGYSHSEKTAVYMEGVITPGPLHVWQVDELTLVRAGNDRAFFRLETNLDATAATLGGLMSGERPCRLLNISVGGACISSEYTYHTGDKFLLRVKLMEDRPESVMYCQVLRVIEKKGKHTQYGCRFLELSQEDQEKITQNIFAVQRQQRSRM